MTALSPFGGQRIWALKWQQAEPRPISMTQKPNTSPSSIMVATIRTYPPLLFRQFPAKHGSFITCASACDREAHPSVLGNFQRPQDSPPQDSSFPFPLITQPLKTGSHIGVLFLFYKNITCWNRKNRDWVHHSYLRNQLQLSTINKYFNSEEFPTGAKRFPARSEVEPGGERETGCQLLLRFSGRGKLKL